MSGILFVNDGWWLTSEEICWPLLPYLGCGRFLAGAVEINKDLSTGEVTVRSTEEILAILLNSDPVLFTRRRPTTSRRRPTTSNSRSLL